MPLYAAFDAICRATLFYMLRCFMLRRSFYAAAATRYAAMLLLTMMPPFFAMCYGACRYAVCLFCHYAC